MKLGFAIKNRFGLRTSDIVLAMIVGYIGGVYIAWPSFKEMREKRQKEMEELKQKAKTEEDIEIN